MLKQLRLNQALRNLTCGDLEIALVVIGLGVTGLKNTGFMYLLDMFGEGGRTSGAISCVWNAFDWANFGSVDVFLPNGEYGFSLKGSWYWIKDILCCLA